MYNFENALCNKNHEYVLEEDNLYLIGLTEYGLNTIGEIVFIELPEVGTSFTKGEIFSTIESIKTAIELIMPIGGIVKAVNEKILSSADSINELNIEDKWLIKVESETFFEDSLDLIEYNDYLEEFN